MTVKYVEGILIAPEPRFEVIDADEVAGNIIPKGSGRCAREGISPSGKTIG